MSGELSTSARRRTLALAVAVLAVVVSSVALTAHHATATPIRDTVPTWVRARFGTGPLEGPTTAVQPATVCAKTIVVNFIVYGAMTAPVSNGCWAFNRIVQNTSTFSICQNDKDNDGDSLGDFDADNDGFRGSGPNLVFDETDPGKSLSNENSRLFDCGNGGTIYAEYMHYSAENTERWCSLNVGLGSCWRKNGSVPVTRYFAELYSNGSQVRDLSGTWPGAGSSGSRPTIDITPDKNNEPAIDSDVGWECSQTPNGGYMSIYGDGGLDATNEGYVQGELNTCTQFG